MLSRYGCAISRSSSSCSRILAGNVSATGSCSMGSSLAGARTESNRWRRRNRRVAPRRRHGREGRVDTVTSDAVAQPRHAVQRARRRSRAGARVRQPRLPARRGRRDQAPLRREALDRVPARVPGLEADTRCSSRAGSRSCSSSTRRPRSPPAIVPAPSAATRTTAVRDRSGTGSTPATSAGADAIDARLHAERVEPGTRGQRRHEAPFEALPDGTFVVHDDAAWLVLGERLLRWAPSGYTSLRPRPRGRAAVLTPPTLVAVLREGWQPVVPLLHPSARALATG